MEGLETFQTFYQTRRAIVFAALAVRAIDRVPKQCL